MSRAGICDAAVEQMSVCRQQLEMCLRAGARQVAARGKILKPSTAQHSIVTPTRLSEELLRHSIVAPTRLSEGLLRHANHRPSTAKLSKELVASFS